MAAAQDYPAFRHLGADKAASYRRVLDAFARRRDAFTLQLRPAEVLAELGHDGGPAVDDVEVGNLLGQLTAWGNLERLADDTRVATIEQFQKLGSLYSLSAAGIAAEKALAHYREVLDQEGRLDRQELRATAERLRELEALLGEEELDFPKARAAFDALTRGFDWLAEEAQEFLLKLQSSIDLQRLDVQAFLQYKHQLLGYLQDFLQELTRTLPRVRETLGRIPAARLAALLDALAEEDASHRLRDPQAAVAEARRRREGQWAGIARWFVGGAGGAGGTGGLPGAGAGAARCRADELSDRAVAACAALAAAASGIGDRHHPRVDRGEDLKTLAGWFLDAPDDEAAHGLWRAVTGLQPARHLRLDAATRDAREQEPVPAATPWAQAPPLALPIRLRQRGAYAARGRGSRVIDRSEQKRRLRQDAAAVAAQVEEARRELATDGPQPLSAYAALSSVAFAELFDLLGAAFAQRVRTGAPVEVQSADRRVRLALEEAVAGAEAVLHTRGGTLRGPDFVVEVSMEPPAAVRRKPAARPAATPPVKALAGAPA